MNNRVEAQRIEAGIAREHYDRALQRINTTGWSVSKRRRATFGYALALQDTEEARAKMENLLCKVSQPSDRFWVGVLLGWASSTFAFIGWLLILRYLLKGRNMNVPEVLEKAADRIDMYGWFSNSLLQRRTEPGLLQTDEKGHQCAFIAICDVCGVCTGASPITEESRELSKRAVAALADSIGHFYNSMHNATEHEQAGRAVMRWNDSCRSKSQVTTRLRSVAAVERTRWARLRVLETTEV